MTATDQTSDIGSQGRKRVLGLRDITLFTVSAMLVIDQLPAAASIGPSVIAWWLISFVVFLVPSVFIIAELSTTYPDQGGLYVWIKQAFGHRWAARSSYWYWVNVALWMPSVFLLFAGTFAELFAEDMGKWPRTIIAIALTWLVVFIGTQKTDVGKSLLNVGALFKVIIITAIIIGGFVVVARFGAANSFDAKEMLVPDFQAAKFFLPVLIFQLLGFDLIATMAGECKNPEKDMPKAFAVSGSIIAFLYLFGTLGILLALPLSELGLVSGLVGTFEAIFGDTPAGQLAVYALGIAALYTFVTNMITWSMGVNRAAVEAADGGELPAAFGREHPVRRTPTFAFYATGVISTSVLIISTLLIENADALFFAIFASSSVIFLLPYLLVFPSLLRLRKVDPDTVRPYRAPGGHTGAVVWTVATTFCIAAALVLFLWTPGEPIDWAYTGWLLTLVVVAVVAGEILVASAMRSASQRKA